MKGKILLTLLGFLTVSIAAFLMQKDSGLVFKGADLPGQLGFESNGSKVTNGKGRGFLTYGPYKKLQTGTYEIRILEKNIKEISRGQPAWFLV